MATEPESETVVVVEESTEPPSKTLDPSDNSPVFACLEDSSGEIQPTLQSFTNWQHAVHTVLKLAQSPLVRRVVQANAAIEDTKFLSNISKLRSLDSSLSHLATKAGAEVFEDNGCTITFSRLAFRLPDKGKPQSYSLDS